MNGGKTIVSLTLNNAVFADCPKGGFTDFRDDKMFFEAGISV